MLRGILIATAMLAIGCDFFSPSDISGIELRCEDGRCPSGYSCANAVCVREGLDEFGCPSTNIVTSTVGSGGDFDSMASWESSRQGNLVSRQLIAIVGDTDQWDIGERLEGDSCSGVYTGTLIKEGDSRVISLDDTSGECVRSESLTGVDSGSRAQFINMCFEGVIEEGTLLGDQTSVVEIDGSTTDANFFLRLTTAPSLRHAGIAGSGPTVRPATAAHGIEIHDDHTVIEWLEIRDWADGSTSGFDAIHVDATGVLMQNVILHSDGDGVTSANGVELAAMGAAATLRNAILYELGGAAVIATGANSTFRVENVSALRCGGRNGGGPSACIEARGGTIEAVNVIALEGTSADFDAQAEGQFGSDTSRNLSSDNSAPGQAPLKNRNAVEQFQSIEVGEEDLHLVSGADAIDGGLDLGSSFGIDIDGDVRPTGSWDIGADER